MDTYYGRDLAWVHHTGYSQHVENTAQGIVHLLRESGLPKGAQVLDVGCGSGLLARRLLDSGFMAKGIDASPAMIDLARSYVPGVEFRVHAKVTDDWAILTRFSHPAPFRFDRDLTVFRREGDHWRRSDEHHRNVTFDPQDALQVLRDNGIDARQRTAFGEEKLPEGLIVLTGKRSR
jgi:SAM-dependent methyltransferase